MSLPAQPWPYAFWPARLDLALTGHCWKIGLGARHKKVLQLRFGIELTPPSCQQQSIPTDSVLAEEHFTVSKVCH